jgi:hypothetical protein
MSGVFAKFVRGIEGMKYIFLHQFSVARLGFELTSQFGCFVLSFSSSLLHASKDWRPILAINIIHAYISMQENHDHWMKTNLNLKLLSQEKNMKVKCFKSKLVFNSVF